MCDVISSQPIGGDRASWAAMQQYRSRQSSFCPPRFTPGSHQSNERIESLQNYIYNKLTHNSTEDNTQHERKCASLALPRSFQDDYSANPGLGPSLSDTDVSDSPLILHMILTHTARTVPIIGVKPLNTTVICHVYNSMHSAVQSAPGCGGGGGGGGGSGGGAGAHSRHLAGTGRREVLVLWYGEVVTTGGNTERR